MSSAGVTGASKCASRPHSSLACCGKDLGCLRPAGLDGLSVFSRGLRAIIFFSPHLSSDFFLR